MKITCLTDSLNSGGAQRQFCMLAVGLKRLGHEVELITYYQLDFFRHIIDEHGISLKVIEAKSKIDRILNVRRAIRDSHPEIVISYLNTPNMFAEVSGLPFRNFGLIVSERNTEYAGITFRGLRRFLFHLLADVVVTNSYAQADFISRTAPWLKSRLTTIPNCVDLDKFCPAFEKTTDPLEVFQMLVLGRFEEQKNPVALLSAIEIIVKEHGQVNLVVDWYGNDFFIEGKPTLKSSVFLMLKQEIARKSLGDHFRLHPPEKEVVKLYHSASVLCLPSLYEGCSNVICEAMACGKPVLASRVGDNSLLVEEGINGFLFSPNSPRDIADTIMRFISLPQATWDEMGRKSREKAEEKFSPANFSDKYQDLFGQIKKLEIQSFSSRK